MEVLIFDTLQIVSTGWFVIYCKYHSHNMSLCNQDYMQFDWSIPDLNIIWQMTVNHTILNRYWSIDVNDWISQFWVNNKLFRKSVANLSKKNKIFPNVHCEFSFYMHSNVSLFFENQNSVKNVFRFLWLPHESTIGSIIKKFQETSLVWLGSMMVQTEWCYTC